MNAVGAQSGIGTVRSCRRRSNSSVLGDRSMGPCSGQSRLDLRRRPVPIAPFTIPSSVLTRGRLSGIERCRTLFPPVTVGDTKEPRGTVQIDDDNDCPLSQAKELPAAHLTACAGDQARTRRSRSQFDRASALPCRRRPPTKVVKKFVAPASLPKTPLPSRSCSSRTLPSPGPTTGERCVPSR